MKLRLPALGLTLDAPPGARLFDVLRAAGVPLGASCDGDGICGRCALRVRADGPPLPPPGPAEARTLTRQEVPPGERLACFLAVEGDLTLDAPYW
jgi:ferredoxin